MYRAVGGARRAGRAHPWERCKICSAPCKNPTSPPRPGPFARSQHYGLTVLPAFRGHRHDNHSRAHRSTHSPWRRPQGYAHE
eukprot:1464821-Prymnesium_polylepis.1